jgi:hypothetical protein
MQPLKHTVDIMIICGTIEFDGKSLNKEFYQTEIHVELIELGDIIELSVLFRSGRQWDPLIP